MPYTTIAAGTTITASWANTNVRDQVVTPFASAAARDSAITSPVTGMTCYVAAASPYLSVFNGTSWVCVTPQAATVGTLETTTSATYTDLSTSGPAVSVVTGTKALVTVTCFLTNNTVGDGAAMAVAVSGATTLAAADAQSVFLSSVAAGQNAHMGATFYLSSLTAGTNTFTAKYMRVTGGTASFADRTVSVTAIP